MRRTLFLAAVAAASIGMAILPASAAASIVELGDQTKTPLVAPTCPPKGACTIVLTRVTALETVADGKSYPTTVKHAGRLVSFTVGLSNLAPTAAGRKKDIDYLNSTYGGDAQVELSVLKPYGKARLHKWKVVAASPVYHVVQYLGSVAQFPLLSSIEVKPKEVIALTTPTWAPVLSIGLSSSQFRYRQSRGANANCSKPAYSEQAQTPGHVAAYGCLYSGTRAEYAATEVTYPLASNPVH